MIRKSFVMKLKKGFEAEYKTRHDRVTPGLLRVIKAQGVHNYSIFLHQETLQLFAYAEIEDEKKWNAISQTKECKEWWAFMADIMDTNPDKSPVAITVTEVFHLD